MNSLHGRVKIQSGDPMNPGATGAGATPLGTAGTALRGDECWGSPQEMEHSDQELAQKSDPVDAKSNKQ